MRLLWYFVCFGMAFYGLSCVDFKKFTNGNGPKAVTLLFLLTASLAYLLVQVLYFLAWGI